MSTAALFGLIAWGYRRFVLASPDPTLTWVRGGVTYELLNPKLLGALLIAPWFVAVLARSLADLPWQQRLVAVVARIAFVALVVFGLARFARSTTSEKVCTVVLVDVSDSVPDESVGDARSLLARAFAEKRKDDVVRVVTFARRPRLVEHLDDASAPPLIERHSLPCAKPGCGSDVLGAGTNIQEALELAYGLYPPGYLKRAVLLSDGLETEGDVLAEANRARELGVRLFAIPYTRPVPGEVAVRELVAPEHVKIGETFELHADIYASRPTRARARLFQGETLNGLDGSREIELVAGRNVIAWPSVVRVGGPVTYVLELSELVEDKFAENNRVSLTIDVPGRPSVLYVEGAPEQAGPLSRALTAQGFDVDVRPPSGMPGQLRELERYDFAILSDTPKDRVSIEAQSMLEQYVRDLGGGFLFAGGESGYGLGGWYHSTVERMLPVRMDNERKKETPSVAMALVIDRSGSMTGLPLEMAKNAAKATASVLGGDDLLEVIAFDSAPTRYVKMQPARNRGRIAGEIARIAPGGGTEIFPALDAAYQDMTVTAARKKHVILLTDGKAPSAGIRDLASAMIAESITVTTVGLGGDVDEQLLKMIADVGGGRFHAVPDPNSLPRIFTKETEMVARAAAVEEWFPVTQVGAAQFLRGVDVKTAPNLHGYVSTKVKPSPAQLFLTSDTEEPVLARWRVGLGWTLAWTSDVKARWAVEWLRWPGWARFWGQLVHEHMRQKHRRELDMKVDVSAGVLHASVDAFGADERFENGLVSKLSVVGPEPGGTTKLVDFRQTAPGRYEASLVLEKFGSYVLKAEHAREGNDGRLTPVATSSGHASNPYPLEYASFEPDRLRLERASKATLGAVDPASFAAVFDPAGEKVVLHEELWPKLVFAAIAMLLVDLLVRRVRLFDRKFVPSREASKRGDRSSRVL